VLIALIKELNLIALPVITEEEAELLWKTTAKTYSKLAEILRELHFLTRKLPRLDQHMLLNLIRTHGWSTSHYETNEILPMLRTFVQLVYHRFLDLNHYESKLVLTTLLSNK